MTPLNQPFSKTIPPTVKYSEAIILLESELQSIERGLSNPAYWFPEFKVEVSKGSGAVKSKVTMEQQIEYYTHKRDDIKKAIEILKK